VVRAADEDGVDVLAVEHLAVVEVRLGTRRGTLQGFLAVRPVDVAHGDDLGRGSLVEEPPNVSRAPA